MTMNCDQVFDILTRGPFPSGQPTDEPVELHLATCHDCRCLAEALRPAVDLVHESIEDDNLPGYQGELAVAAGERMTTAVMSAVRAAGSAKATDRRKPASAATAQTRIWQVSSIIFLAAALCFALVALGLPYTGSVRDGAGEKLIVTPAVLRHQPDETGVNFLLSIIRGSHCQPTVIASVTNPQSGEVSAQTVYHCCTECHAAQRDQMSAGALSRLARSCGACHAE